MGSPMALHGTGWGFAALGVVPKPEFMYRQGKDCPTLGFLVV